MHLGLYVRYAAFSCARARMQQYPPTDALNGIALGYANDIEFAQLILGEPVFTHRQDKKLAAFDLRQFGCGSDDAISTFQTIDRY
nr:hypothetical protein [Methyloferula stellata]